MLRVAEYRYCFGDGNMADDEFLVSFLIRKQILVGVNGRCLLFQGWFIGLRWAYKPCACNRLSKIGGRGEEICQILSFLTVFAKRRIIAIFYSFLQENL